jgi:hypothetical protein
MLKFIFFFFILSNYFYCIKKNAEEETDQHKPSVKADFNEYIKVLHHEKCPGVLLENPLGIPLMLTDASCLLDKKKALTNNKEISQDYFCQPQFFYKSFVNQAESFICKHFIMFDEKTELNIFEMEPRDLNLFRCERTVTLKTSETSFSKNQPIVLLTLDDQGENVLKTSCQWSKNSQVNKSLGLSSFKQGKIKCPIWPKNYGVVLAGKRTLIGFYRPGEKNYISVLKAHESLSDKLKRFGVKSSETFEVSEKETCSFPIFRSNEEALY